MFAEYVSHRLLSSETEGLPIQRPRKNPHLKLQELGLEARSFQESRVNGCQECRHARCPGGVSRQRRKVGSELRTEHKHTEGVPSSYSASPKLDSTVSHKFGSSPFPNGRDFGPTFSSLSKHPLLWQESVVANNCN